MSLLFPLSSLQGEVKIGDFGFAAQLTKDEKKRRTRLGTPYWYPSLPFYRSPVSSCFFEAVLIARMAPEVIKGKKYDYSADIWSLGFSSFPCSISILSLTNFHFDSFVHVFLSHLISGILMYECAEGDPPYANLPRLQALLNISKNGCPPLSQSHWSAAFRDFLRLCVKKRPEKRANISALLLVFLHSAFHFVIVLILSIVSSSP